jgi:hypothetical protein
VHPVFRAAALGLVGCLALAGRLDPPGLDGNACVVTIASVHP